MGNSIVRDYGTRCVLGKSLNRVRGSDALLLWVRGPLEARLEEALGDGGAFPGGTALAGTVRVPGAGGPGARGALTRLELQGIFFDGVQWTGSAHCRIRKNIPFNSKNSLT